jgi:hypothetical protein
MPAKYGHGHSANGMSHKYAHKKHVRVHSQVHKFTIGQIQQSGTIDAVLPERVGGLVKKRFFAKQPRDAIVDCPLANGPNIVIRQRMLCDCLQCRRQGSVRRILSVDGRHPVP